jgi:four helix bundle protein
MKVCGFFDRLVQIPHPRFQIQDPGLEIQDTIFGIRNDISKRRAVVYKRFEELPVWQASLELALATYAMTAQPAFRRQRSLRDQLERAALSVSNNIAEGFERGTNQELLTILYISRGSAGEVRSMLCVLERMPAFRDLESGIQNLKSTTESISKQLGAWIRALRDSEMKGERYVTEKTLRATQARQEREEFLKKLEQIRKGSAPSTANP